ncbi:MAG: CRISPR-associated endonuclease Cas1 [Candidatus Micrarchaeota archaeon]
MQLIINDHAAFLGKHSELFYVRIPGKPEQEFAADKVEQIIISAGSSVSVGAVQLAMEKEIDIVYLAWNGMPIGRVYPCKLGGTTLTRKKQLEAYGSALSTLIVTTLLSAKLRNQAYLLKSLAKTRKDVLLRENADKILTEAEKLAAMTGPLDTIREPLLGLEGYSGSVYWDALSRLIPLPGRDKSGSNLANALLNYGYGILYSEVEKACIIAGLDPYLGFLHSDRYGKPSMVLDLIEEFRPVIVDRAVVTLFAHNMMAEKDFEQGIGTGRLTKSGRDKILSAVLERLHTKITLDEEQVELQDIILRQARQVAHAVLDEKQRFRPFIYKW